MPCPFVAHARLSLEIGSMADGRMVLMAYAVKSFPLPQRLRCVQIKRAGRFCLLAAVLCRLV